MSRVVTRSRVVSVAGLVALTALAFSTVSRADGSPAEGDDPSVASGSGTGLGARVAGPVLPGVAPRFVDAGIDGRVTGAVARAPVEGRISRTSLAVPTSLGTPTTEQAVPYRVEPRDANGNPPNAWDLPPEEPDPRDFERAETFDAIASPHYEIREEIWNNPEDLVTNTGLSRYGGVAYVPFWGRNALRWGRLSVFPFAHIEGVWHSNLGEGDSGDGEEVFEIMASVGALGEYWASGGKTKIKAALRADYHWYDTLYDDAVTYVGGASVETKLSAYHTIELGGEVERARRAFDLDTTGGAEENMFDRESVFVNGRWDRFLSNDLRLEAGGSYSWIDEIDSDVNGGDYEELDAFARLGWAIMRHESFAYVEGRYEERNASEDSDASDLDHAYEVRVGVNGIQPHARTRRVVGNIYAGWRTETYTPSDNPGPRRGARHRGRHLHVRRRPHVPAQRVPERLPLVPAHQHVLGRRELQHGRRADLRGHAEPLAPRRRPHGGVGHAHRAPGPQRVVACLGRRRHPLGAVRQRRCDRRLRVHVRFDGGGYDEATRTAWRWASRSTSADSWPPPLNLATSADSGHLCCPAAADSPATPATAAPLGAAVAA
jgi:hypothetical protein